jgi:two-component system sensor histidine kinase PilS (NtrC family)
MSATPDDSNRRWHLRRHHDRAQTAASLGLEPGDSISDEDAERRSESVWANTAPMDPDDHSHSVPPWYQRFFSKEARRAARSGQTAFHRIYRVFLGARAALGLVLLASLVLSGVFGSRPSVLVSVITLAYAAQTLSLWTLHRPKDDWVSRGPGLARLRWREWFFTIGIDITCYLGLYHLATGSVFNPAPMLVLPVLMAGVLTPRLMAMGTAAMVAIGLLVLAWATSVAEADFNPLLLTQAGLAGSGFFVVTVLAGELAGRLAREERSAKGSLELARQQAQLNRLMIEEMQDGVLVVDRLGRVRAANPAARRLLAPQAMCAPAPFNLGGTASWGKLVYAVEQAFLMGAWPEEGRDIELNFGPSGRRVLRLRVRFTKQIAEQSGEELCVLLIEDVRSMQARTRQEKLAAMGRMSAGIAHEIRNPLAAIAQANALLSEDAVTPGQRQLTRMVSDNVDRLKRIIEDVLEAAPAGPQYASVIDIAELTGRTCSEWAHAAGVTLGSDSALWVDLPQEPCGAAFDPDHLRRVLVNLLDNAWRHGSRTPGALRVRLCGQQSALWELSVSSDGPPIPSDVEPYLFEPFFSTRSRGTGLGLYVCRELCERYGASIEYRLQPGEHMGDPGRNDFFLVMPQQSGRIAGEPTLPLPQ